jgi:hypothetical protein
MNKVTTNLTYIDLLKLQFNMFFLTPLSYVVFVSIWIVAAFGVYNQECFSCYENKYLELFLQSGERLFYAIIILFIFSTVAVLLSSSKKNGILGTHHFEILENGLFETTEANETLTKWTAISKVKQSKSLLYIQVSSFQIHIIPKNSFETEDGFLDFAKTLNSYIKL